jgi:hypothetical protein
MIKTTVLSENSTLYAATRGSVVVTQLAPGHVLLTLFGYNDGELAPAYYGALNAVVAAAGFLVVYMDSREQTGISSSERDRATVWTKELGSKYRAGHLLFRSRLLELAVAIANLALGGVVRTYSKVEAFEKAIAAAVPGFKSLPDFKSIVPQAATS